MNVKIWESAELKSKMQNYIVSVVVLGLKCRQWLQYLNAFSQSYPDK